MSYRPQQVILNFHGIGTPPATLPEAEKPYWIGEGDFHKLVSDVARQAREMNLHLLLTFDDGNKSDIEIAAPLLKDLDLPGIFFPCTGRLAHAGYLDAEDLRTLAADGFGIGSHGVDHLPWARLGREELKAEIAGSKATLDQILPAPVDIAALPFGSYRQAVLGALWRAGYKQVFTSDPGFSRPGHWFQRRFSWHEGVDFDLERLTKTHSRLKSRLIGEAKKLLKSMR